MHNLSALSHKFVQKVHWNFPRKVVANLSMLFLFITLVLQQYCYSDSVLHIIVKVKYESMTTNSTPDIGSLYCLLGAGQRKHFQIDLICLPSEYIS